MIVKSEIKKAIPPKPIQPEASPGQSAIYCVLLDSMSDRKTQYIAAGIASLPMCRCIRRFTKKKAASDTTGRKMFHHVSLASIRKKQIKNPICARRKTIMPASICLRLLLIWYSPIKRSPTAHRTNGTSII